MSDILNGSNDNDIESNLYPSSLHPDNLLSPVPSLCFPLRYGKLSPEGKGANGGGGKEHMFFLLHPCINAYVLPEASLNLQSGAWEAFRRMYGEATLNIYEPKSLRDLLRIHTYETGFLFPGDLNYYLGIQEGYLSDFLTIAMRSKNLVRYKGDTNFTKWFYYLFQPNKEPFRSYVKDSPIAYAGKVVSARTLPHAYSVGLSLLCMYLYSIRRPCYRTESSFEVPIGNYGHTAPGKSKYGSEVTADAICTIWKDGDSKPNVLLLEQDMCTETYTILLRKLVDYTATSLYESSVAGKCSFVLSCNKILSVNKKLSLSSPAAYVAVYLHLCAFATYECRINAFANGDFNILPYVRRAFRDLENSSAETWNMYQTFYGSYFTYLISEGAELDVTQTEVLDCCSHLGKNGQTYCDRLFLMMGFSDYEGNYLGSSLTLGEIKDFLLHLPPDTELLMRLVHNQELYSAARDRRNGFAKAILDVIYGKRRIATEKAGSGSLSIYDETMYFAPILAGYSIYAVASALLTNYMPYILWDMDSEPLQYLYGCLSAYYPELSKSHKLLSPVLDLTNGTSSHDGFKTDGIPYPFKLRNCHTVKIQPAAGDCDTNMLMVCIEDIDSDTGACVRAYLFARYYAGASPVKLILLADSVQSAREFFEKHIISKGTPLLFQSPRCRVALYNGTSDADKGFIDVSTSGILFLERGCHSFGDGKLFSFSSAGEKIVFAP